MNTTKDINPKPKQVRFSSPPPLRQKAEPPVSEPVDSLQKAVAKDDGENGKWKKLVLGAGLVASGLAAQSAQAQVVVEIPQSPEQELIKELFVKDAAGNLRPDLPEPTSATEAKAYKSALERAQGWGDYLSDNMQIAGRLKRLDNSRVDLNSEQGTVVIHRSWGRGDRTQESSSMLKFDNVTGQILEYEANVEGKNFVTTDDKPQGAPVKQILGFRFTSGPMDSLSHTTRVERLDEGGEVFVDNISINETAPGRIEISRTYRNTFEPELP